MSIILHILSKTIVLKHTQNLIHNRTKQLLRVYHRQLQDRSSKFLTYLRISMCCTLLFIWWMFLSERNLYLFFTLRVSAFLGILFSLKFLLNSNLRTFSSSFVHLFLFGGNLVHISSNDSSSLEISLGMKSLSSSQESVNQI